MQRDFIPATDADYALWTTNFSTTLTSVYSDVGITLDQVNALNVLQGVWDAAFALVVVPATRTSPNIAAKVTARVNLTGAIRGLAKTIQAFPATTDDLRAQLGLTVKDPTPSPIPTPVTKPVINLVSTASLQATLRTVDESTPLSRAKPFGAVAAQVFAKIGGTAPVSVADCEFQGIITKPVQTMSFTSATAGSIVWLLAQWQTRTGLVGPVSDVLGVTIPH